MLFHYNNFPADPNPPQSLTITGITATSVTMRWTLSNQAHVNVTGFEANCSSSGLAGFSSSGTAIVRGSSVRLATVTGLEEHTLHRCCVSVQTPTASGAQSCRSVTTREAGK